MGLANIPGAVHGIFFILQRSSIRPVQFSYIHFVFQARTLELNNHVIGNDGLLLEGTLLCNKLLGRARDLSSNAVESTKKEDYVVSVLKDNGYPKGS